jgi:hypothetical protein
MRRVDVPSSLFAFLLVYTFLERALDRARRLANLERTYARNRAENHDVGYVEILARHANRLFDGTACNGV